MRTAIAVLTRNAGNIALLGMGAELGLLPPALASEVADAYRDYRRLQHKVRLTGAPHARVEPDGAAPRRARRSPRCGGTSSATHGRRPWIARPGQPGKSAKIAVCRRSKASGETAMSMADRDGWIWYDGKMVPWREATTHVLTHTLHYGMGVFEGVRCYKTVDGPAIFRLRDHTDRLFRSAHIFGMKIPFTKEEIDAAQLACVRDNKLDSCYLRPLVFYGSQAMGVAAKSNPVRVAHRGVAVGQLSGRRGHGKGHPREDVVVHAPPSNITMCNAKAVGNYTVSILANQEALHDGYEEAHAARPAGLRLPGLRRERLHRPRRRAAHARPVERRAERHHPRHDHRRSRSELGIPVHERRITRDEVYIADEAFFTGTAAEVTPIRELDNRTIGDGIARPDHHEAAGDVLRRGQRPHAVEEGLADEGVTMGDAKRHDSGRGQARGPARVLPQSGDAAVVVASARVPRHRGDRRGDVPLLRNPLRARGRAAQGRPLTT